MFLERCDEPIEEIGTVDRHGLPECSCAHAVSTAPVWTTITGGWCSGDGSVLVPAEDHTYPKKAEDMLAWVNALGIRDAV